MGGFLTIDYFFRTIGYCFLEIFVCGGQGSPPITEKPEVRGSG